MRAIRYFMRSRRLPPSRNNPALIATVIILTFIVFLVLLFAAVAFDREFTPLFIGMGIILLTLWSLIYAIVKNR